jgi:hypothetical protein
MTMPGGIFIPKTDDYITGITNSQKIIHVLNGIFSAHIVPDIEMSGCK